jgi:hypothetical protein
MIPILAELEGQGLEVTLFLFLAAALLVLSVVILRFVKENGYRLILLALLTATAGIGCGAFLPNAALVGSGMLMKIAFITALGGVGSLLLSSRETTAVNAPTKEKGAKDAD